jgi:hypothetical protein
LISGLINPDGIALDGQGHLFVANYGDFSQPGSIGEYTTSGSTINASLISGLARPTSIALDGNGHLFESNVGDNTVKEYITDGVLINGSLIAGLSDPITLLFIPEPSSATLLMLGMALFGRNRIRFGALRK